MPTVIGHHNISKDTKHWLCSPKRQELFGPLGITNIRTFVDPQNPKRVAVMMDVPDMDALAATMQSKEAADAMAFDGVVPKSLVILVEAEGVSRWLLRSGCRRTLSASALWSTTSRRPSRGTRHISTSRS